MFFENEVFLKQTEESKQKPASCSNQKYKEDK